MKVKARSGKSRAGTRSSASSIVHTVVVRSAGMGARIAKEPNTSIEDRAAFSRAFVDDADERSRALLGRITRDLAQAR